LQLKCSFDVHAQAVAVTDGESVAMQHRRARNSEQFPKIRLNSLSFSAMPAFSRGMKNDGKISPLKPADWMDRRDCRGWRE